MEETGFKDEVDGAMARDCSRDSTAGQTAEEDLCGAAKEAALGTGSESAPPLKAPLICCAEGLDKDTFKVCKEVLRPFKSSLRKLNLSQHHLMKKRLKHVQESLAITGNCIDQFLHKFCRASEVARWQKKLWQFVSLFSELEADQLEKMYVCIKKNQMDKFQIDPCQRRRPQILKILPVPSITHALSYHRHQLPSLAGTGKQSWWPQHSGLQFWELFLMPRF
ncbi:CHD1 helical C-terminal domain containing protein 1 isoform X2 [Pezoporus flaviventris]|uniref:CHD1 helical C-terminal domain containing protein 1 isoform X2 n=1 Tax=Pezoporus flaviventris TaxID=889875 RepID=UPI002AB22337|nr:CHD1 helical C-terminal domain containing protein 1 isoform X2 [Pezoporus flaviventris]